MKKVLALLALLSLKLSVSEAKIQILNPGELKETIGDENGYIEAGMANFGHIDYGTSFLGQVFIPITNKLGCEPFVEWMFDEEAQKAIF